MVSFGNLAEIKKFSFQYIFPGFFIFENQYSVAHSLDLFVSTVDPTSGMFYVSTTASFKLFKYSSSDLTSPASQQTFTVVPSFSVVGIFKADWLVLAGTQSLVKFANKASMSESGSHLTACAAGTSIVAVLHDGILLPASQSVFDLACDSSLTRVDATSGTLITLLTPLLYAQPVTNVFELPYHNYVAVAFDTYIQIVKRTNYDPDQTYTSASYATMAQGSVACCELELHSFTFAALTGVAGKAFSTFRLDVDFCASYDGLTCLECSPGYKRNSTEPGNVCLTQDEYPPLYGAKDIDIAPCIDKNCTRCLNSFDVCEVCPTPYFINTNTSNCSDLDTIDKFGRDPANASLITPCLDSNCLNCKADFALCVLCQEEFFDLREAACIPKDATIQVNNSWFNESESKAYIQLNQGFYADPNLLYPSNLSVQVLDSQNDSYTEYKDLKISGNSSAGLIVLSLDLQTSIYNGLIKIVQTAQTPVFYNKDNYMSNTIELTVDNVRQIRSSLYFMLQDFETAIKSGLWALMFPASVLGALHSPILATYLLRAVADASLLAHANGPLLHTADVFLDIVGKTALPLWKLDEAIRKDNGSQCVPPPNFQRRYKAYASCSLFDVYSKSLLWFLLATLVSLPIYSVFRRKLKAHQKSLARDHTAKVPESLPAWAAVAQVYGPRFLVAVAQASAPLVLQLAGLALVVPDAPIIVKVAGSLIFVGYFALAAALFRFTYLFLDFLHLQDLKQAFSPHLKMQEDKMMGSKEKKPRVNIVLPKNLEAKPLPKSAKIDRLALNQSGLTSVEDKDSSINPVMPDSPTVLKTPPVAQLSAEERALLQIELEVLKNRFGFLYFFIMDFKKDCKIPRYSYYYLPVLELLVSMINAWVVTRLSDAGMAQVLLLFALEWGSLCVLVAARPFASSRDLALHACRRALVGLLLLLKLLVFAPIAERSRQLVDVCAFGLAVAFVVYGAAVALVAAARGVKQMCGFKARIAHQRDVIEEQGRMLLDEQEKRERDKFTNQILPKKEGLLYSPYDADGIKMQHEVLISKVSRANKLTGKNLEKIRQDNKKLAVKDESIDKIKFDDSGINYKENSVKSKYSNSQLLLEKDIELEKKLGSQASMGTVSMKKSQLSKNNLVKEESFNILPQPFLVNDFNPQINKDVSLHPSASNISEPNLSFAFNLQPGNSLFHKKKKDRFAFMLEADVHSKINSDATQNSPTTKANTSKVFAFKSKIANLSRIGK